MAKKDVGLLSKVSSQNNGSLENAVSCFFEQLKSGSAATEDPVESQSLA